MTAATEQELLTTAFQQLTNLLADDEIKISARPLSLDDGDTGQDAMWEIQAPNYHCTLLVQAFKSFMPRDVDRVLGGSHRLIRKVIREDILIVAPWLSPRSKELLRERHLNYIDMTGNVWIRIHRPTIHIRLEGADQDPNPVGKPPVRLQGSKINSLVRVLVDYEPPYKLVDLAAASGLSNGYVSRALDGLEGNRVIERHPRNRLVTNVDWRHLLRARVEHYNLIRSNRSQAFIARGGAKLLLKQLALANDDQAVVTGSFAATEYVQVAAPSQLTLYVPGIAAAAERFGLMPAKQGANVILLTAADASQLARARVTSNGFFHVGISQLVQDCLAGNGRLPEEGEALLEWMAENTPAWRERHLPNPM